MQKSDSAERKRKKREFALFPPSTVEIQFKSPKPLGRGGARVLSKIYCSGGILKRQRGKETGEETQGKDVGAETEM